MTGDQHLDVRRDPHKRGEDRRRLDVLSARCEAPGLFTDAEPAALDAGVSDSVWSDVTAQFDERAPSTGRCRAGLEPVDEQVAETSCATGKSAVSGQSRGANRNRVLADLLSKGQSGLDVVAPVIDAMHLIRISASRASVRA